MNNRYMSERSSVAGHRMSIYDGGEVAPGRFADGAWAAFSPVHAVMGMGWLVVVLTGLWSVSALADQTDARLPGLFDRLAMAHNQQEAASLESQIWLIWLESGRDDVNELVGAGTSAMSAGR